MKLKSWKSPTRTLLPNKCANGGLRPVTSRSCLLPHCVSIQPDIKSNGKEGAKKNVTKHSLMFWRTF